MELNIAENTLGQISNGKKCQAPKKKKYIIMEEQTQRLKEQYLKGEIIGGTKEYLKKIGFLHQNVVQELKKTKKSDKNLVEVEEIIDEVIEEEPVREIEEPMPGRNVTNRNRFNELQELGFGKK